MVRTCYREATKKGTIPGLTSQDVLLKTSADLEQGVHFYHRAHSKQPAEQVNGDALVSSVCPWEHLGKGDWTWERERRGDLSGQDSQKGDQEMVGILQTCKTIAL